MYGRQFGAHAPPPSSPKKQQAQQPAPAKTFPRPPGASPSPNSPGATAQNATPQVTSAARSPLLKALSQPGGAAAVRSAQPTAAPTPSPPSAVASSSPKRPFSTTPPQSSLVRSAPSNPISNQITPSAAPTIQTSGSQQGGKPLAITGAIRIVEPALGQLNSTYAFAKGGGAAAHDGASAEDKLKFLLQSPDERVANNAIVIASQLLDSGQGVNFFVNLLLSPDAALVRNACNLLTNYAQQPSVIGAITQVGFTNLLNVMRKEKAQSQSPYLKFLCNCMNNDKTSITFIKQGGLIMALDVLTHGAKNFDDSNAALLIANNSVASVKDNFFVFAEEATLKALVAALKAKIDPDAQAIVVRILVSITNDDTIRTLFVKMGVINDLAALMRDPESTRDPKLNQMLVRLIGNLLKGSSSAKHVINAGAMEYLSRSLASPEQDVVLPALASIANFALNDKIVGESSEKIVSSGVFTQLNRLVAAGSKFNREVRLRSAIAMSNLMTIDSLQKPFDASGGTKSLVSIASANGDDEEIRLKCLGGLFHLSMYTDAVRSKIVEQGGLKVLTDFLGSPNTKPEIKTAAAKALVNLSLNDETETQFVTSGAIKPLVQAMQDSKTGAEFQGLASMCLENLSYNSAASDAIRETGGLDAAIRALNGPSSGPNSMQEHSIKLLSKLAINGKNRQVFQEKGGAELLQKVASGSRDANLKQLANVAINNMAVPHFEDVSSSLSSSTSSAADDFADLKGYGLGDDDDDDDDILGPKNVFGMPRSTYSSFRSSEAESEAPPQMPDDDDEEQVEQPPQEEEYDDVVIHSDPAPAAPAAPVAAVAPAPAPALPPRRIPTFVRQNTANVKPASPVTSPRENDSLEQSSDSTSYSQAEEDEFGEEEDRGLKKETYMLADESGDPNRGKKFSRSKIGVFMSKIKEKITGMETNEVEAAAAAALPTGPWKVQEERVTNHCAAVLYDYFDYWCENCKKNGSTCDKEFDEARSLRMKLIRSREPKSYKEGTKNVVAEPFLPASPKTVVKFTASPVEASASPSSSSSLTASAPPRPAVHPKGPPPPPPPKPLKYRGNSLHLKRPPLIVPSVSVTNPGNRPSSAPIPKPGINALAKSVSSPLKPMTITPPRTPPPANPAPAPAAAPPPGPAKAPAVVSAAPKAPSTPPMPRRAIKSLQELPPDADPARVEAAKLHFKRTRIAQELLETEGTYVKSLAVIVKKFQNPLLNMASSSSKPLASEADIRTIFSSIEIIYSINSMLLEGLNAKMRKWSSRQTIGDVFLFMGDFLKTYTDYINHYDTSQMTVLRCMQQNPRFARFLDEMAADPLSKGLGLPSFLVMPVQRVPRYSLLLRELIKTTPKDHPDHQSIVGACDKVDKVAAYLNEKRKEFDSRFKLLEIAHSLLGEISLIVQPHRELVAEYATSWEIQNSQNGKKSGKGKLFLFNDAILLCKQSSKTKQKMAKLAFLTALSGSSPVSGSLGWKTLIPSTNDQILVNFAIQADQSSFLEKFTNLTAPDRASRAIRY